MLLQGYKVVELATYIAGPAACCMMGDWGADVVKIEALTGDPIRFVRPPYDPELPDIPPNFEIDNHGKKSIALDISRPEGRQIVEELLADADVFVTSFREGSLARAGLGFEAMRTLNPRLVCANVSGYGLRGPGAEMNAFDLTAFWSRSGLALQGFPPDSLPANVRPGWGDHITAVTLALGIMTALLERAKTGEGRVVEASLLTAALYVGSYDIVEFLRRGQLMPNLSRAASDVAAFYQSQDGRWFSFFPRNPERDWATIFTARRPCAGAQGGAGRRLRPHEHRGDRRDVYRRRRDLVAAEHDTGGGGGPVGGGVGFVHRVRRPPRRHAAHAGGPRAFSRRRSSPSRFGSHHRRTHRRRVASFRP
jgi:crotonobetainyl-CoA:carnitine CoA-transferase CaiB-like acyl-CoA transferase